MLSGTWHLLDEIGEGGGREHVGLLFPRSGRGHEHLLLEDRDDHARSDDDREKEDRAHEGAAPEFVPQQHGAQKAERHDDRNLIDHIEQRGTEVGDKIRILGEQIEEILEADRREAVHSGDEIDLGKRVDGRLHHRDDKEEDRADHPGEDEKKPMTARRRCIRVL